MALQLWMPLIGDLRNQGLSNYSISTLGSISWVNGKLGATAMRAGDGTQIANGIRIEDTFTELLNGPYSVSVWVKPYGQHIHYNGSIFSSGNWNTAKKRWAFGVSQDNTKVDVLCSDYNTYVNCTVPVNEWTHLVCTCGSDRIVKLYKNGEYVTSVDRSAANVFDSDNTFTCIGRESYANGYFSFNGALQDFRLYDHCLSSMEVKLISQGLVLHYPLNRNGWGQENILTNSSGYQGTANWSGLVSVGTEEERPYLIAKRTDTTSTSRTFCTHSIISSLVSTWTAGTKFTISGYYKIPSTETYDVGGNMFIRWTWTPSGASSTTSSDTGFTTPTNGVIKDKWIRFENTYSVPTNYIANGSVYFYLSAFGRGLSTIYWKDVKLEIGEKATPWIPAITDTLATTMGLNSTIEYDCSGFCNNGNKMTDTITYTSDTPKYAVSTHFNGTYDGILIENLALKDIINSTVTYAFWIKPESESSGRSVYFGSYSGTSWSIEKTAGGQLRLYWNGSPDETCSGVNITDGVWQHICITKNGTNDIKVYINGVQKWSSTAAHNNLNFPTTYRIGRDTRSNDGTPYRGLMSDFRIYATALSASNVQSLYQNCATIDPDGTIRGQIRS